MDRWAPRLLLTCVLPLAALLALGCQSSAVGDPCIPEDIPEGGFKAGEALLELDSLQCRTRVCLIDDLGGDPTRIIGEDPACDTPEARDLGCLEAEEVAEGVFCSCRCGAPAGATMPTCSCPSGFICQPILATTTAGVGARGSYCVRE